MCTAALAAALTLGCPGAALAAHDLSIYKVEAQVTLDSDDISTNLSCHGDDLALDGMWRLDHADQDDDDNVLEALPRSVDVLEAYSIDGQSTYHYRFSKNAIGRAQLKVFVTCLGEKSDQGDSNHRHTFSLTGQKTAMHPAQTGTFDVDDFASATPGCDSGELLVQPGYKVVPTPDPDSPGVRLGRLFRSAPTDDSLRTWAWSFAFGPSTGDVSVYVNCLPIKIADVPGHKHKLVAKPWPTAPGPTTIPKRRYDIAQLVCGSQYKAVVAGFRFSPLNLTKFWFLGMEPQIKSRVFKFMNTHNMPHTATVQGMCLNYRTT
jgi:hypothetical protein